MHDVYFERKDLSVFQDVNVDIFWALISLYHRINEKWSDLIERPSNFKILLIFYSFFIFLIFFIDFKIIRESLKDFIAPNFVETILNNSITIPVGGCYKAKIFFNRDQVLPFLYIPYDCLCAWSGYKAFSIFSKSNSFYRAFMFILDAFNFLFS